MRLRTRRKRLSSSSFSNFFTCGGNLEESHASDSAVRRRTSNIEENALEMSAEMSAETGNHSSSLDYTITSFSDSSLQMFIELPQSSEEENSSATPSINNSIINSADNQVTVEPSEPSNRQVFNIQFLTNGSFTIPRPSPPRSLTRSISRTFRLPSFLSTSFSGNRQTQNTSNNLPETQNKNNREPKKRCESKNAMCIHLGHCFCNDDSKEAYFEEIFEDSVKVPENNHYQYDFLYSCVHCRANLAIHSALISRSFQGSQGRAYLFDTVVNVREKKAEQRLLLTGLHDVADIFCKCCHTMVGWKYERAYKKSQKYKVRRPIHN